ncbi:hypothetical protein [Streptomyces sasae]|uniref:hypothetical protein n=1 Tax=Streptomyces sasae TaxID=1266772 RepID=UPI0029319E5C|nr:hypothetical protein [Streptomyces sasae]
MLEPLTPAPRPGAVVVTDNVGAMRGDYADHTAWIRLPDKGFVSLRASFRTGTEDSVRPVDTRGPIARPPVGPRSA